MVVSKNKILESRDFDIADWLRENYLKRRAVNRAYSMRSFARDLGVGSGRLSEYMSRKRRASAPTLCSLVDRLEPNRTKAQKILRAAADATSSSRDKEKLAEYRLSEDQFALISEGIHYAILSLVTTDDFDPSPKVIAAKLKSNAVTVATAWDRLVRLGFLSFNDEKWCCSYPRLSTSEDIKSTALRRAHREILAMAEKSLDQVSLDLREITSITMAIDPQKIPEAKKMIREFRDKLSLLLEGKRREEVYELVIALFPHASLQ